MYQSQAIKIKGNFFLLEELSAKSGLKFKRICGPVVRMLALRSGVPRFKTHSDHSLNLFLVVPGSTSRPHL